MQASKLLNDSGITIGTNELFDVILDDNNKVIGASWVGTHPVFSFDIVVDPEYQRNGYAKQLIDSAMQKYNQRKTLYDISDIRINTVNPNIKHYLMKTYDLIEDPNDKNVLTY